MKVGFHLPRRRYPALPNKASMLVCQTVVTGTVNFMIIPYIKHAEKAFVITLSVYEQDGSLF